MELRDSRAEVPHPFHAVAVGIQVVSRARRLDPGPGPRTNRRAAAAAAADFAALAENLKTPIASGRSGGITGFGRSMI
jgi:hypothetical protein